MRSRAVIDELMVLLEEAERQIARLSAEPGVNPGIKYNLYTIFTAIKEKVAELRFLVSEGRGWEEGSSGARD